MPRHAKIRIVGTIAAIPLSMLWFGTATSQSTVSNSQSQSGAVTASQTLDVVTASSDTTATTAALGNSFVGSVVTGNLGVTSTQSLTGNVAASTVINVATNAGPTTQSVTSANGNAGSAVIEGGGAMSGSFLQVSGAQTVDAESQINGPQAQTDNAAFSVQAAANTQELGAINGAIGASIAQSNSSTTTAHGGVVLGDIADQGTFSASATGNDMSSVGTNGSAQNIDVGQGNSGAVTEGAMFANFGQSEITSTSASATGNNASVTNTDGTLQVSTNQDNQSFIHAESVETSYLYGGASVDAEAVGNSDVAANVGPSIGLDNVQLNGAQGVESSASFQGNTGYDSSVNASAVGNSVTGFACSACGGVMNVENSQTNLGDVAASSSIGLTGTSRSTRGSATAVGNNATFYVSSPN
jgi:hypothetical protein